MPRVRMSLQHQLDQLASYLYGPVLQNQWKNLVVWDKSNFNPSGNSNYHLQQIYWSDKYIKKEYLSEMVFSKSTKAPPHIKRISFVSICSIYIEKEYRCMKRSRQCNLKELCNFYVPKDM